MESRVLYGSYPLKPFSRSGRKHFRPVFSAWRPSSKASVSGSLMPCITVSFSWSSRTMVELVHKSRVWLETRRNVFWNFHILLYSILVLIRSKVRLRGQLGGLRFMMGRWIARSNIRLRPLRFAEDVFQITCIWHKHLVGWSTARSHFVLPSINGFEVRWMR